MKTVRFTQVVEKCGKPHVHALWVEPERDPEFVRARKGDRVMTVDQPASGKADVGFVGFDPSHGPGAQFLVFPKSLKPFAGTRVVGVKFDLVEQPPVLPADKRQRWKPVKKKGAKGRPARPAPKTTPGDKPPERASRKPERESPARERGENGRERETTGLEGMLFTGRRPGARKRPPSAEPQRARPAAPAAKAAESPATPRQPPATPSLRDEVIAALAELRDGKTVAAYQRLERAARGA